LIFRVEADAACDFRKLQIPGRFFDSAYESDELITPAPRIAQLKSRRAKLKSRSALFPPAVGATIPARSHSLQCFEKTRISPGKPPLEPARHTHRESHRQAFSAEKPNGYLV
jgi:hypothetical protein